MILHTINKSPFQHSCFEECINCCVSSASILLIEDGVYAATAHTKFETQLQELNAIDVYALAADVKARGLESTLNPHITLIDDAGFVELVTTHSTVQSWY